MEEFIYLVSGFFLGMLASGILRFFRPEHFEDDNIL